MPSPPSTSTASTAAAMIKFCPNDGSMLLVGPDRRPQTTRNDNLLFFYCEACPYAYPITRPVVQAAPVKRRPLDDILGGEAETAHMQRGDTVCPVCKHTVGFFYEVQTRSADEAATLFWRCERCAHRWRENN